MDLETLDLLEFDRVLEIIAGFAESAVGKTLVRGLLPYEEPDRAKSQLQQVEEALLYSAGNGRLSCGHLGDLQPVFSSLESKSGLLSAPELLAVLQLLQFVSLAKKEFEEEAWPTLAKIFRKITIPQELVGRLSESISEKGEIRESAYPELARARLQQSRSRLKVQEHLNRFQTGSKAKYLIPEPYITQRAARYVIPVRVDHQKQIPGIMHGASSSGATVFIEPLSAVELNNQCIYFRELEAELIQRILVELTQLVRAQLGPLEDFLKKLALVDALFSCAEFSQRFKCTTPELVSDRTIRVVSARHPLLIQTLGRQSVVPLSLGLEGQENVLVISGPNNGGKTVALKTVGLLCAMAQAGLPVPAEDAKLPILRNILADAGDHQSIIQHLSTFSSHIKRINELLENRAYPCLLLLDEVGRGTDPTYGAALAVSIIEHFRSRETLVIATTHHRAAKAYADTTPGVKNASVQLDEETLKPTYVLEFGVAGSSSGLEIAEQLGMNQGIITRARSLLDATELEVESYLMQLRTQLQELQCREREALASYEALERKRERLEEEARTQEEKHRKEFEERLREWGEEFRSESFRYLKRLKDRFDAARLKEETKMREAAMKEAFRRRLRSASDSKSSAEKGDRISVGDTVFHTRFEKRGVVVSLDQNEAKVEIGGKRISASLADLQRVTSGEMVRKPSERVTLNIVEDSEPELNLIGTTVDEASEILDKFLDRAFVTGLKEVRVIHGFGTGRLKTAVSRLLREHPQVEAFNIHGGSTIVTLRR